MSACLQDGAADRARVLGHCATFCFSFLFFLSFYPNALFHLRHAQSGGVGSDEYTPYVVNASRIWKRVPRKECLGRIL